MSPIGGHLPGVEGDHLGQLRRQTMRQQLDEPACKLAPSFPVLNDEEKSIGIGPQR